MKRTPVVVWLGGYPVEVLSTGWYGPEKFLIELSYRDVPFPSKETIDRLAREYLGEACEEFRRIDGFIAIVVRKEPTEEALDAFVATVAANIIVA